MRSRETQTRSSPTARPRWHRLARALALSLVLAGAMAPLGGCLKVRHLGDNTGKSYDKTFGAQTRAAGQSPRWQHKPMESELGSVAVKGMVKPASKSSSSKFSVPLMTQK